MARSYNKVTLIGNLGQDPEIRNTQTGTLIAGMSIATSKQWKDKETGERKEITEWHRISVFNQMAVSFIKDYVRKGNCVLVEGELRTRKWTDNDGIERYTTEVVVLNFSGTVQMMDKKNSTLPPPANGEEQYGTVKTVEPTDNAGATESPADIDDEIPF